MIERAPLSRRELNAAVVASASAAERSMIAAGPPELELVALSDRILRRLDETRLARCPGYPRLQAAWRAISGRLIAVTGSPLDVAGPR